MPDQAYVYILASSFKKLYTGVTTRLMHRVADHKSGRNADSFTSRYKIDKLVYYECHATMLQAIARETQIKGWLRSKKIELIVGLNPEWRDLSLDWNEPIQPFDESKLRLPTRFNSARRVRQMRGFFASLRMTAFEGNGVLGRANSPIPTRIQ